MSRVVSETSSSRRGTSIGPVTETRTFVPSTSVWEPAGGGGEGPVVHVAEPSALERGSVETGVESNIFIA
jgi:hypothetical protein